MLAVSQATGSRDSSGLVGGQSAISTNFSAARSEQVMRSTAAIGASAANQRAADARSRANNFRTLAGFGKQLYQWGGGFA